MSVAQVLLTVALRTDVAPALVATFDASNQAAIVVSTNVLALVGAPAWQLVSVSSDGNEYPITAPVAFALGPTRTPVGALAFPVVAGNPAASPLAQTLRLRVAIPGGASVKWTADVQSLFQPV
jgi:hypothetical protein